MPPHAVKTIKDLIFYQYAKIIASSAAIPGYKFVMNRMKMLSSGEIKMSVILRELKMQMSGEERCCEYCRSTENLSWDHLIPRSKNGPDTAENGVWACRLCNSSKGSKGIYEWYGVDRKDELPRLVAGKYLKLLYEIHEARATLNATDLNGDGRLDVLDLEVF
ncbi:MAG: HNH endonuclease [Chlamydiota bacterium]